MPNGCPAFASVESTLRRSHVGVTATLPLPMPIYVEQRLQQHHQGVARAQNALRCQELAGMRRESMAALDVHIQDVEQIRHLEIAFRRIRTDVDDGFQGLPVVERAQFDDAVSKVVVIGGFPVAAHGDHLRLGDGRGAEILRILIAPTARLVAENRQEFNQRRYPAILVAAECVFDARDGWSSAGTMQRRNLDWSRVTGNPRDAVAPAPQKMTVLDDAVTLPGL